MNNNNSNCNNDRYSLTMLHNVNINMILINHHANTINKKIILIIGLLTILIVMANITFGHPMFLFDGSRHSPSDLTSLTVYYVARKSTPYRVGCFRKIGGRIHWSMTNLPIEEPWVQDLCRRLCVRGLYRQKTTEAKARVAVLCVWIIQRVILSLFGAFHDL